MLELMLNLITAYYLNLQVERSKVWPADTFSTSLIFIGGSLHKQFFWNYIITQITRRPHHSSQEPSKEGKGFGHSCSYLLLAFKCVLLIMAIHAVLIVIKTCIAGFFICHQTLHSALKALKRDRYSRHTIVTTLDFRCRPLLRSDQPLDFSFLPVVHGTEPERRLIRQDLTLSLLFTRQLFQIEVAVFRGILCGGTPGMIMLASVCTISERTLLLGAMPMSAYYSFYWSYFNHPVDTVCCIFP